MKSVAALHQGASGQMTWLEDPLPWLFLTYFCSCDIRPNLYPVAIEIYTGYANMDFQCSRLSKVIVRQTDTTEIIYHAASW